VKGRRSAEASRALAVAERELPEIAGDAEKD
jgi:hypothetical protein